MEFDTKERTKFFCCARERGCAIGSGLRIGHSALRHCTPHTSRPDLPVKRRLVSDANASSTDREAAADSLSRRGIHPFRRCTGIEHLQHSVIHWPGRIYFGLFAYDRMHHIYINCIGYLLDTLIDLMTPRMMMELDRRGKMLPPFRKEDGTTTRRAKKLSSSAFLTAEMKVVHLFVLSHALGSKASLLREEYRAHALQAISSLQIICYSMRGWRPFTLAEHNHVFRTLGKTFFRSLSVLQHSKRSQRIAAARSYNEDKPPSKRRRVPTWNTATPPTDESSDTATSSEEDLPPYFLRSDKVVPHSFVHFPEQVRKGGSHKFNDTSAQESTHPDYLKMAGARSRVYHSINSTLNGMNKYNGDKRLLEEICRRLDIDNNNTCPELAETYGSSGAEESDGNVSGGAEESDGDVSVNSIPRPSSPETDPRMDIVKLTNLIKSNDNGLSPLRKTRRGMHAANDNVHHDIWDRVLCAGVPVSLRELVSLVCAQLAVDENDCRQQLLQCRWELGWHVTHTLESGFTKHYWGGGVTPETTSRYQRGDWVEIAGTEPCRNVLTSRLARVICGVKVINVQRVLSPIQLDNNVWENGDCKSLDYVVYLLVRYASPHPDCGRRRGPDCRPLCPGHLSDTHCLWEWCKRPVNFRRGCWRDRPWQRHRHLFGDTVEEQQKRKRHEARAWYDLVEASDITSHANVSDDWDRPYSFLQSVMWC